MIKELIKSIDKKEWKLFWLLTIFIILLTTLPYVYGWLQTEPGNTYLGLHSLTPGDIHVYFSYMEQVRQGHFVSEDLYTSEPQSRVMLNSFWSLAGLVGLFTGLSNNLVFQGLRILLIPVFLFILYLLAAYWWPDKKWRKIAFVFLCFASGAGASLSIFMEDSVYAKGWYNWPLDIWAPESNNLLTMFQSPHLIASTSLIIIILMLFFWAVEKNVVKYSVIAGLAALWLFQFHPFHVPTVIGVMAVYVIIQFIINKKILWRLAKHFVIIAALGSPSVMYYFILEYYDMVTQIRTFQNVCLTPSWWVTIISYGFVMILAVYAIYKLARLKQLKNRHIFLIVWLAVQLALMYSPLAFQRRIMQGLQIPMLILAVIGLKYLYDYLKNKIKPDKFNFWVDNKFLAALMFIFIFTPSQMFCWIREMTVFLERYPQLYVPAERVEAYQWLKDNTPEDAVILTDLYNGNLVPGRAGRKVYVGHGVETLWFDAKLNEMGWFFYKNDQDEKKKDFLTRNGISYVFFSKNEDGAGDFAPEEKDYLDKVFEQEEARIYRVKE